MAAATNVYFELTREFNAHGRIALLCSGQAVVYYRVAIMSKDGDWILRETPQACQRVLEVLEARGARYRAGAPLDVRWLEGGWSSHFEFQDERGWRIRCDFFTRPPRISDATLGLFFEPEGLGAELAVVDVETLIRMKHTQRAKDYPVIGELARLLPPELEVELTTDPDRILELAPNHGEDSGRTSIRAALEGKGRLAVVIALAEETDRLQQEDRTRVELYEKAAEAYRAEIAKLERSSLELPAGHQRLCGLAERLLPFKPSEKGAGT